MSKRIIYLLVGLTALLLACGKNPPPQTERKGEPCVVERVLDGDTFVCKLQNGQEEKVRLIGVDTPESSANQKAHRDAERSGRSLEEIISMGKEAKAFTQSILKKGTTVYLETDVQKRDKYGRLLAYVWLEDGRMLNKVLVEEGYAQVYTVPPNVKYQDILLAAQRKAVQQKKGMWR
ncbi:nuclease (SNase domain protein) [Thermocrinis albus DSM 14484]|uniref:Nuclease (SNase domain protein) n=1 Tax=Thermocrinis albus (strain DSM 14484 / JCM 11386 / HI 11/12) TaxID=638303 RepID=D3SM78_THEAH|nr:thermonuclease family protein [Thermocrinis albus]ADC89858.1 nuclease (SNase domain protein) [Thermocrinis albus DSM 14484]